MNTTTEKETYLAPFADAVLMEFQQIICVSQQFRTSVDDVEEKDYDWEI